MPVKNNAENTSVSASAEVTPTADAISGSVNPNPNNNLKAAGASDAPAIVLPAQSAARSVTSEFLAALDALIGQTESIAAPLPTIDAARRTVILRQANADPGFALRLKTLLSRLDGEGTAPVPKALVEALAAAASVLSEKESHLVAAVGRIRDLAVLVRRELVFQLRIAKSALEVLSEQSPQALKAELAQVGSRFLGRRKVKARAKAASVPGPTASGSGGDGVAVTPSPGPAPAASPLPHAGA